MLGLVNKLANSYLNVAQPNPTVRHAEGNCTLQQLACKVLPAINSYNARFGTDVDVGEVRGISRHLYRLHPTLFSEYVIYSYNWSTWTQKQATAETTGTQTHLAL
jgi:hypothetical protein